MTVAEFKNKIDSKIKQLESGKALQLAVLSVNNARVKRLFEDGLNSNGTKIGTYNSTKPVYINPDDAPRKGNQIGKRGKKIKSLYYPSYKAFRKGMGKESEFVNLRLNNELQNDLANAVVSKSTDKVASPKPIKISNTKWKITLKKEINTKKVEGLEKKYGKFLDHTKEEIALFNEVYSKEVQKILR